MSYVTTLRIDSTDDISAQLKSDPASPSESAVRLAKYMNKLALSCGYAKFDLQLSATTTQVSATGTLTLTTVVATNTCSVGGVTFTATASTSPTATQFTVGASDTATATSLAAQITANPTLMAMVKASSVGTVVTCTAVDPGAMGNFCPLASGQGTIVASASTLTGGVNRTPVVCHLGL